MRLDLYQAETARIARQQSMLLDDVRERLLSGQNLTLLEQGGVLHAFQLLIENAIGKAKQIIKQSGDPVPVSAYDAFSMLQLKGGIEQEALSGWLAIVGLRNRIVHDYMNIDFERVSDLVRDRRYQLVVDFLLAPMPEIG